MWCSPTLPTKTGDAALDHTLNQALEIDLEQSPFLNLLPRQKVKETLLQMQRKGDEALTPELAHEVCERNNAQAVLHGTLASLGSKYLLTLAAESCVSDKRIAGYKAEVNSKEDLLRALDTVAGHVRRQLGESAASLDKFQTPIEQATTSSLEALRDYSLARDRYDYGDWKSTEELLKEAHCARSKFRQRIQRAGDYLLCPVQNEPGCGISPKRPSICALAPPSMNGC
jgi:Fe-S-cluster containining protein